jgi:hypothetical protein
VSTASQFGTAQIEEVAPSANEVKLRFNLIVHQVTQINLLQPVPEAHTSLATIVNENVQKAKPQTEAESQTKHPENQSRSLKTNEPSEPRPVTPPPPPAPKPVALKPNVTAFSSFANAKSPFTKYSNTPFPSSTSTFAPAWRCGESRTPGFSSDKVIVPCPNDNALSPSPNEVAETSSAGALGDRAQASTAPKASSRASPPTATGPLY